MLAHFGPNLQLPLAKYLQMLSDAVERSWLKGQAFPAWQAPWRKNLQGTWDVFGGLRGPSKREAAGPGAIGWPGAPLGGMFRLPLRAWRYSGGMLEGRCVSRHQGEPLG